MATAMVCSSMESTYASQPSERRPTSTLELVELSFELEVRRFRRHDVASCLIRPDSRTTRAHAKDVHACLRRCCRFKTHLSCAQQGRVIYQYRQDLRADIGTVRRAACRRGGLQRLEGHRLSGRSCVMMSSDSWFEGGDARKCHGVASAGYGLSSIDHQREMYTK